MIDNNTGATTYLSMTTDSIIPNVCSGDYTVSLTDVNECSSSVIPSGNNQAVVGTVNPQLPTPQITITDNVDCYGDNTGAIALVGSPNINYIYTWNDINGNLVGTGNSANSLVAGEYYVMAQYQNSGSTITACAIISDTLTITQPDEITINETVDDVDCNGGSTGSITVNVQGGTLQYTHSWSNGGTAASISGLSAGMYDYTVVDANGCVNILQNISVNEPTAIVANISQTPPGGFVLTANPPSGGVSPYTYSWREQSSPSTSLGAGMTYSVFSFGTYYLVVTDANGCEFITNSFTYTPTGLFETNTLINIHIYPNPFNEETTVDFGRVVKDVELRIFDVLGKLLNEYELKEIDKFIIEREDKVNGVYFIEMEIEGVKWFNKIILE